MTDEDSNMIMLPQIVDRKHMKKKLNIRSISTKWIKDKQKICTTQSNAVLLLEQVFYTMHF